MVLILNSLRLWFCRSFIYLLFAPYFLLLDVTFTIRVSFCINFSSLTIPSDSFFSSNLSELRSKISSSYEQSTYTSVKVLYIMKFYYLVLWLRLVINTVLSPKMIQKKEKYHVQTLETKINIVCLQTLIYQSKRGLISFLIQKELTECLFHAEHSVRDRGCIIQKRI